MEKEKLEEISKIFKNLMQSGKVDQDLSHVLNEHIKVTESISIKLSKVINEISGLVNELAYISDALEALQNIINK